MIGFFIAMISGASMAVQGVFNTQVTKTTGMWVSNVWVQLSSLTVCALAWFIMGRDQISTLTKVEPKYMLLGGVIGAGITWTVIKSMEMLGPAKATLFIVSTQLCISYLIEVLGLFGVEKEPFVWKKIVGLALTFIGILIFQWKA